MNKTEFLNHVLKELIEKGNANVIEEGFSPDYIAHSENKQHKGHAFLKRFNKILHASIPVIKVVKMEVLVEEENKVTWYRTLQGVHEENMLGIPASKKKIKWNEMAVSRFEGDKIAEEWVVSLLMGQLLLHQKLR